MTDGPIYPPEQLGDPGHWRYRPADTSLYSDTTDERARQAALAPRRELQREFDARDGDLRTVLDMIFRRLDAIEKQLAMEGRSR